MTTEMVTSDAGIVALMIHEGIVPGPYLDSATPPVWTFGIGHTAAAGGIDPAKMPRGVPTDLDAALRRVAETFRADLPRYEADVRAAFKRPLSQWQFDAAVSFHFNTGAIGRADWVKAFNRGDPKAADGFMAWKKPASIVPRRLAEMTLFRSGMYPTGSVTVWGVTEAGRVIWKPIRRLTAGEALEMVRGVTLTDAPVKTAAPGFWAAIIAKLKGL